MSEKCAVCGNRIRLHATTIKDGSICAACRSSIPFNVYNHKEEYTAAQIYEILHEHDGERSGGFLSMLMGRGPENTSTPRESKYDEIREYKRLLDEGIITEEEFRQKKAELLDVRSEILRTILRPESDMTGGIMNVHS